jgi:hypothetical protein
MDTTAHTYHESLQPKSTLLNALADTDPKHQNTFCYTANFTNTTQSDAKRHQTTPTDMENCHVHHQRTQSQHDIPRGDGNGNARMALREQRFGM